MFVGVNDTYIDFVDSRLIYTIGTKIHHVESWGSFAKNEAFAKNEEKDEADYRRKTIRWGKNASLGRSLT